jgi:hypothetical protein
MCFGFSGGFEIEEGAALTLSQVRIEKITKEPNHEKAVELAVGEIVDQLRAMDESGDRPHVAIVALPVALIERVWNAKVDSKGSLEKDDSSGSDAPNFRGMLKAKAMGISFPIQIVWEDVVDAKAKIPRKVKETSARKIQDPAGITWNLLSRIPWRRMPREGEYTACYVGISFYREAGGQQLFTSAAQMFDERGRGFVLKGKRAHTESRGRHPYMTQDDAYELISNVLGAYKTHHRHFPARVIVLKTSRFRDDEAEGMLRALTDAGAELRDLVWVQESYAMKLLREATIRCCAEPSSTCAERGCFIPTAACPTTAPTPDSTTRARCCSARAVAATAPSASSRKRSCPSPRSTGIRPR